MIRVGKVTVAQWLTMDRPNTLRAYIEFGGRLWRLHALAVYVSGAIDPILHNWGAAGKAAHSTIQLNDSVYLCQGEQSLDGEYLSTVRVNGLANVPPNCFALRGTGDPGPACASTVNSMPHAWSLTGSTSDSAP